MSAPGKFLKALILGAPASGKGTVSARIVKKYDFQHISSGDKLRWHIEHQTPLGLEVKHFSDEGKLVPDEIIIKFMMAEIGKVKGKWLLDGFPRTASQADQLWQVQPVDFVINLNVPFQVIIERVKGRWVHLASGRVYNTNFNAPKVAEKDDVTGEELTQRPDDKPEAVQKRLNIYKEMIDPVITFYKSKKILHEFKGYTTDEIWPEVVRFLDTEVNK